jgi:hypothetical protein
MNLADRQVGRLSTREVNVVSQNLPPKKRQSPQDRLFEVKVLRSASKQNRFWWLVRERDGRLVDSSSAIYDTEAEAFRAGNAAARVIASGSSKQVEK